MYGKKIIKNTKQIFTKIIPMAVTLIHVSRHMDRYDGANSSFLHVTVPQKGDYLYSQIWQKAGGVIIKFSDITSAII